MRECIYNLAFFIERFSDKIRAMKIRKKSKIIWVIFIILLISTAAALWLKFETVLSPVKVLPVSSESKNNTKTKKVAIPSFNKNKNSTIEPNSIWTLVNKQHPLTELSYTPTDLIISNGATIRVIAKVDFDLMLSDTIKQSINLNIVSSYRSYSYQSAIYNNYISIYGQTKADTFSARPGYSEHQTGLAIDFGNPANTNCNLDDCFGTTPAGQWLAAHSYKYGFILRYPADKQSITGYKYEPWHFRYVGRELAMEMKKQNIVTLEEFFHINGGEIYIEK